MKILVLLTCVLIAQVQARAEITQDEQSIKRYTGNGITFLYSDELAVSTHSGMISVNGTNDYGVMIVVYSASFQTVRKLENITVRAYERAAQRSGHSIQLRKIPTQRIVLGTEHLGTRIQDVWSGKPRVTEFFFVEKNGLIVQIALMLPPSNHPQRHIITQVLESLELEEPQQSNAG